MSLCVCVCIELKVTASCFFFYLKLPSICYVYMVYVSLTPECVPHFTFDRPTAFFFSRFYTNIIRNAMEFSIQSTNSFFFCVFGCVHVNRKKNNWIVGHKNKQTHMNFVSTYVGFWWIWTYKRFEENINNSGFICFNRFSRAVFFK